MSGLLPAAFGCGLHAGSFACARAIRAGGDRGEPVAVASGPAADVISSLGATLASTNLGLAGRPLGVSPIQH